uniref:Uncharacterized protein n=1 Tax=Panagrolaimus superbus TaxID=310955 RepID=A0A914Y510_9BILA
MYPSPLTTSQEVTTETQTSPITSSTPEYENPELLGTSFIIKTLPPNLILPSAASASNGITLLPPQIVIKNAIENRPTDYQQQPDEENFSQQQPSGYPNPPPTIDPINFVTKFVTLSPYENLPTISPTINSQPSGMNERQQTLVPLIEENENFEKKPSILRPQPIVPLPKSESVDEDVDEDNDNGRVGGLRVLETAAATSMIPPTFMPENFEIPTRKVS